VRTGNFNLQKLEKWRRDYRWKRHETVSRSIPYEAEVDHGCQPKCFFLLWSIGYDTLKLLTRHVIVERYLAILEQQARAASTPRRSSAYQDHQEQPEPPSPDVDSVSVEPSPADPRTRTASAFPRTHSGPSLADGGGYRYGHVPLSGSKAHHPQSIYNALY
jgi:hypothetical protein